MQSLKSKIFNETKFIQFLKQVRWHFCQVYIYVTLFLWSLKSKERERNWLNTYTIKTSNKCAILCISVAPKCVND